MRPGSESKRYLLGAALLLGVSWAIPSLSQMSEERARERQELKELGMKYENAWDFYLALKEEAGGGSQPPHWEDLPDWRGLYSRDMSLGILYDQEQEGIYPDIKLTPEYHAALVEKVESANRDIEYDPISGCTPPGHPRWLTSPFLREQVVTPDLTLLISEVTNSVRRVYTDGRDHPPELERYPLPNGDSVGFWDGDRLIVHTNQLKAGQYTRSQPDYSDEVETLEIWYKMNDRALAADVWVYDPPALLEPWYSRHIYYLVDNPDDSLRIRYWYCQENPNNAVYETEDGTSQFSDFNFNDD